MPNQLWGDSTAWLVEVLAAAAWKSVLLLAVTALLGIALRRASPATRHWIWTLGIISALGASVAAAFLPQWQILPSLAYAVPEPIETSAIPDVIDTAASSKEAPATGAGSIRPETASELGNDYPRTVALRIENVPYYYTWVILIWGLVFLVMLVRLTRGLWNLWKLQRRARIPDDQKWGPLLRKVGARLGIRRNVVIQEDSRCTMPMTWGILRPRILIPPSANRWSRKRREAVLMHELGHIKRGDWLAHLIGELTTAIFWFNPLAWVAVSRMRVERERACDNLVLGSGVRASTYAGVLLKVAAGHRQPSFLAPAIAMASSTKLESRLRSILDSKSNRRSVNRFLLGVGIAVAAVVAPVLAMVQAPDPSVPQTMARWGRERGFTVRMMRPTTLDSDRSDDERRRLPFSLGAAEERDAARCASLARTAGDVRNGQDRFDSVETRHSLEEVLGRRPNYFYAEFLLGIWHRDHHDGAAGQFLEAAYRDAPVVLAFRFIDPNCRPLARISIANRTIQCVRTQRGLLNENPQLSFPDLMTDDAGVIYLPVYDTVYRTADFGNFRHGRITSARLGWFRSVSKVSVLPAYVIDWGKVKSKK